MLEDVNKCLQGCDELGIFILLQRGAAVAGFSQQTSFLKNMLKMLQ